MDVHLPLKFATGELGPEMVVVEVARVGGGLWIMPLCGFVDRHRWKESSSLPRTNRFGTAGLIALA